ncbi:metal-dependent transcriptional regulator [Catalinimonas niigatensis]|uniref:metal-dependent transcriptional regulator n=1 Tax=Catalinimonas niigatensis TaxID=1397264 RepID=UPI00266509DC|nr:metal-dependent transcriptional regulator [Catalinimonas niigatensis]WPP50927.1 metal-dependent transcriptional regulator [Catalinimonas niigatensis]
MQHTLAEENYLKAIYHLSEGGKLNVSTNALAAKLETKPASATDMIRKLADKDLVIYEKYQGVNVSKIGKAHALKIIRKHRLWETFLVETLGFGWDEVHNVAEQLEHIQSTLLVERLDIFLGHPKFDPHGEPIPDAEGNYRQKIRTLLSDMKTGQQGKLVAVKVSEASFLRYLDKLNLEIGSHVKVLDILSFDHSSLIAINNESEVYVSKEVAANLFFEAVDDKD